MARISAFISGSALLILELLGLRLLTPAFGSSIIVLSSVIGVFLLSMSVGYFAGGWIADRFPTRLTLSIVLFGSAVLISTSALLSFPLAFSISYSELNKWLTPILATFILFSLPSCVLAMTSPIVIRLEARRIEDIGKVAGKIYAISNLGSILGTFAVPLLILLYPVKYSLYLTAGVLLTISLVVLIQPRRKSWHRL